MVRFPDDVWSQILSLRPRDRDASSPTASLIKPLTRKSPHTGKNIIERLLKSSTGNVGWQVCVLPKSGFVHVTSRQDRFVAVTHGFWKLAHIQFSHKHRHNFHMRFPATQRMNHFYVRSLAQIRIPHLRDEMPAKSYVRRWDAGESDPSDSEDSEIDESSSESEN